MSTEYSQPINATIPRRFLILLAVKIIKRLRKPHGPVLFLSKQLCVKCGYLVSLSEVSTLQFVANNTSIPVPRIHCAFRWHGRTNIVMDRLNGQMVGSGWVYRSPESRAKILHQLAAMVEQ